MDDARLREVLACFALHQERPAVTVGEALCATGRDVAGVAGAGLTLRADDTVAYTIAASDPLMAELDELERTLGEGPCIDAHRMGEAVAEPDLAHPNPVRWTAFTSEALRLGARAAYGYPLRVATARLGALNLYALEPGPLTADQHANTLVVAELATQHLLRAQVPVSVDDLYEELVDLDRNQLEVHRAAGMVSVQLGTSITHALLRLRAHAFAEGRPLGAVAGDVVARRLRLEP